MIISCSRRTDIPAFYPEWLMNRLREAYVCVSNPFNTNQISKVNLSKDVVDCIVFWTKDAGPMMKYLDEIDEMEYDYYFQFTITPYQKDIEAGIDDKHEIVKNFIKLSDKIGKERVILRYDPILITSNYSVDYHEKAFGILLKTLGKYTEKVVISFVDHYRKNRKKLLEEGIYELTEDQVRDIAIRFAKMTNQYGLTLETCAEKYDLDDLGIRHGACIDGTYIEKLIGSELANAHTKDGNRQVCGCMQSIDIGRYDTCLHGCTYCYANVNDQVARDNWKEHDPASPILTGWVDEEKVTLRKGQKSFRKDKENGQQKLW